MKYRLCRQIGLEDNEGGFGNATGFVLNIRIPVCLRGSKDHFQTRCVWDIMYQNLEATLADNSWEVLHSVGALSPWQNVTFLGGGTCSRSPPQDSTTLA